MPSILSLLVFPALMAALVTAQSASAAAQSGPQSLTAEKAPRPTRNAGIYHVASGTWTRTPGAIAAFGPDVIYSNTAPSSYFTAAGAMGGFAPGSTVYDEGNVPGTQNTHHSANRDEYGVSGIQIGYCDMNAPGTGGWDLSFYGGHGPCSGPAVPDATVSVMGLPAAGGCWSLTLDLSGSGEFCLAADGGDGFDDDSDLDAFGWSFQYAGTGTSAAGFQLTGDPQSTDPNWVTGGLPTDGTNTYFGPSSQCSGEEATGLQTEDFFFIEADPTTGWSGCYWFGGYSNNNGCGGPLNPYASYSIKLFAESGSCNCDCIYCLSNPNSTGVNSTLEYQGSLSVSDDDFTLVATVPPNVVGFFLTSQEQGFVANPIGSVGVLCLGGTNIGRFQNLVSSSGLSGTISISTASGQWSLGSIPAATGPYAAIAGGQANFQLWHRDTAPGGATSNFTDGLSVTWLP